MRVLYLADSYRPSRSACANRTAVLVGALREAGHGVEVLASSDSLIGVSKKCAVPDHTTYFDTFPLVEKTLINRLRNNLGGQREAYRVAEGMGEFDVVVCTTPPLMLTRAAVRIARCKRARLVLDVRDIWPDVAYEMGSFAPRSLYGRFFEHVARDAYRHADLVVTVSPGKLERLRGRVPGCRVVLVPNGVDEAFALGGEDEGLVRRLRLGEGRVCAYVGNIGLAQGLGTLLDIAKVRPSVRFLLFGEGADRAMLERRASEESISNVEFCGTVDEDGVHTVLRCADIAYVPLVSSRLRDSVPTKMYEALASGCPVLLAAEGDAVALLEESGLGEHAAPEDPEGLLSAFDRLMSSPFSEVERANAAAWTLEKHSRQGFARAFVEAIEELGRSRA